MAKVKTGTDNNKSDKVIDIKEETEINSNSGKTLSKTKTQDLNKNNAKVKTENEKNSKSDRKEDNVKQSEETEDKSNRSKKQMTKPTTELRSASHNTSSSAKKRK